MTWSNKGDTVFDPFMGSGTTGFASIHNDRKFIGCEIDKTYFDNFDKNYEKYQRRWKKEMTN